MSPASQDLVLAYINDFVSRNEELSKLAKPLAKIIEGKTLPAISSNLEVIIGEVKQQSESSASESDSSSSDSDSDSSSSDSDSDSSSSDSDSDSSSSDSDSDSSSSDSDSDSSSSEDDSDDEEEEKTEESKKELESASSNESDSDSSSSSSDDSSSSDSDSDSDSDSSSSSSSSDSESDSSDSDADSSSDSESEEEEESKKRKIEEVNEEDTASKKPRTNSDTSSTTESIPATPEPELKAGQRHHFSRIDRSKVSFEHHALQDNSYKGAAGTWGEKASEKLLQVRGKDFTKNKNKMKRGSYKGGSITLASGSYKFTD